MLEPSNVKLGLPLFLFVAGDSAASLTAYGNIELALQMFEAGDFNLEVVDVWELPERAFEHRVLVTPTLLAPSCSRRLVGDLSKWNHVHAFLRSLTHA
jgi:circadian clock protein KaiB